MPYLVLTIAGALAAGWILWRRRDAVLLAEFFLAGGGVLIADHLAVVWMNLYQYRPGFFLKGTISDSVMGALLTEGVLVPSLVVLYIDLLPGWRGAAAGTLTVTVIEWLFLRMDLFSHHGWRIWYTLTGFAVFFWLADRFRVVALAQGLVGGWPRIIARLGLVLYLLQMEEAFVMQVKGLVTAARHLISHHLTNQGLLVGLPQYLTVVPAAFWVISGGRELRQLRLVAAFGLMTALDYLWLWLGWWVISPPYSPFWHAAGRAATLVAACLLDDMLGLWADKSSGVET